MNLVTSLPKEWHRYGDPLGGATIKIRKKGVYVTKIEYVTLLWWLDHGSPMFLTVKVSGFMVHILIIIYGLIMQILSILIKKWYKFNHLHTSNGKLPYAIAYIAEGAYCAH